MGVSIKRARWLTIRLAHGRLCKVSLGRRAGCIARKIGKKFIYVPERAQFAFFKQKRAYNSRTGIVRVDFGYPSFSQIVGIDVSS